MPIARFQMDDGRIARFEVPDGTTPEQAQGMMQEHFAPTQPSPQPAPVDITAKGRAAYMSQFPKDDKSQRDAQYEYETAERKGSGQWHEGVLKGVLSGSTVLPRAVTKAVQLLNPWDKISRVNAMQEGIESFDRENEALPGYGAAKMGTEIAGTLGTPAVAARGIAMQGSPKALALAEAVKNYGMAKDANMATRMLAGGIAGGVQSQAMNPEDTSGTGMAVGALLPPAVATAGKVAGLTGSAGKYGYDTAAEWFTKAGKERTVGRIANEAAGADAPEMINLLRSGAPEATAGEATRSLSNPVVAAMERYARKSLPQAFVKVDDAGVAARQATLEGVNPGVKSSKELIENVSIPMLQKQYGVVNQTENIGKELTNRYSLRKGVPMLDDERDFAKYQLDSLQAEGMSRLQSKPVIDKLDSLLKTPGYESNNVLQSALNKVKDEINAVTKNGIIRPENLHTIKKQISTNIEKFAKENNSWDKKVAGGVEGEIQKVINKVLDDSTGGGWSKWNKVHSTLAGRSDQAKNIETLKGSLKAADGSEAPAAYLEKIKSEGGDIMADMTRRQRAAIEKVTAQLQGKARDKYLAGEGKDEFGKIVGKNENITTIPILHRIATITNALMRKFSGKGGTDVDKLMANAHLPANKAELARYMEMATPKERETLKAGIAIAKVTAARLSPAAIAAQKDNK